MQYITHVTLDKVSLVPSCLRQGCGSALCSSGDRQSWCHWPAAMPVLLSPAEPDLCPSMAWIGLFWGNKPVLPSATAPVWTPAVTTRNREQAWFLPALRCSPPKEHSPSHVVNEWNSSHPSQQHNPPGITSTRNKKRLSAIFYLALFWHHFFFWVFSKGKLESFPALLSEGAEIMFHVIQVVMTKFGKHFLWGTQRKEKCTIPSSFVLSAYSLLPKGRALVTCFRRKETRFILGAAEG